MMKKICLLALLALCPSAWATAQTVISPFVDYKLNWLNREAPNLILKDIYTGQTRTLNELRGKIVLLNYWFTTCGGCKVEYPGLQQLKADMKYPTDVEFISIATDDMPGLKHFLQNNPLNFTHVADGRKLASEFGIIGYPTNIILDKNGVVRHIKIGGSKQSAFDIAYEIEQLRKK